MDYKDLIDTIRTVISFRDSDCCNCEECIEAIAAIETLLEERDAAQKRAQDLKAQLDMYGGDEGIAAAFQKAAERDEAVRDINEILKSNGDQQCEFCVWKGDCPEEFYSCQNNAEWRGPQKGDKHEAD